MDMDFIINILLPALYKGLIVTILLILCTAPFGLLLGIGLAAGRVYGNKPVHYLSKYFVIVVKGTPLLLTLFILYFGLPFLGDFLAAFGLPPISIVLDGFTAAVIGFILCNGVYSSEYIRGAITSVKEGQITAAEAMGMTRFQAIRLIVLPQALRRAIPGLTNEFIYLIKYSSLAYMITVIELTGATKIVATKYFEYDSFYILALVYLVLVTITTIAAGLLERKYRVPGLTGSGHSL